MTNLSKLLLAVGVSELAGLVGAAFTAGAIPTWYASLSKPALTPPGWLFGPVWTTLYLLMGIALFLVWGKHSRILKNVRMLWMWRIAMEVFFLQLAANVFWSMVFFGLHNPAAAFAVILSLWVMILATTLSFYKFSRTAAYLLLPYLLWVSFAVYLNYSIWMLN